MKILKKFKGHSNDDVLLIEDDIIFVRKYGDIKRNLERYESLNGLINTPKILNSNQEYYDMEYIYNLDMKTFLSIHNVNYLVKFITETINKLSQDSVLKDYTKVYEKKLAEFDFNRYNLPFTPEQLLDKLPKMIPESQYHGDFTLDNMLYSVKDNNFVMIDPLTTEYKSYIFDIAKLRQDLTCKWFIRNDNAYYDYKLKIISDSLYKYYDDSLLILMLLRILPYNKTKEDTEFIIDEIVKLWK